MKSRRAISALVVTVAVYVGTAGCSSEGDLDEASAGATPSITCGPGTRLEGSQCVVDDATAGAGGTGGSRAFAGVGGEADQGDAGGGATTGGSAGAGASTVAAAGRPSADDPGYPRTVETGPYGFCDHSLNYQSDSPFSGSHGWGNPGGDDPCWGTCLCHYPCTTNEDCPSPGSGTAVPQCGWSGAPGDCALPCDNGEVCPDGMSCVSERGSELVCAWLLAGEENFECWVQDHEDYCSQHTTKPACEERLRNEIRQPEWACVWVKETIHSTATDACEPVTSEERCMAARGGYTNYCENGSSCNSSMPAVFWADLGAGTAALLEVDTCYYQPQPVDRDFRTRRYAPCEFGAPTIPLKCDCACEMS